MRRLTYHCTECEVELYYDWKQSAWIHPITLSTAGCSLFVIDGTYRGNTATHKEIEVHHA